MWSGCLLYIINIQLLLYSVVCHGCYGIVDYYIITGADPYCIVKCGGKKATTHCQRSSLDPKFDTRVSFYITDRTTDAVIQVCLSVFVCACVMCVHDVYACMHACMCA